MLSRNITLLAPTDEAFGKLGDSLKSIPMDVIAATLQYHLLTGSYPTSGPQDMFHMKNHTVAMSMLTNKTYVNLPGDMPQAVVLSRNMDGYPVVVSAFGNLSFASKNDSISMGGLSLHGVTSLLTIPLNLTATLAQTKMHNSLIAAVGKANLTMPLSMSPGLTIFAPNNDAFNAATKDIAAVSGDAKAFMNLLANHVVNGTVIYTPDLAATAAKHATDASKKQADGSILVSQLISSTGAPFNITQDMAGNFWVNSNHTSARLVMSGSDFAYNAGVIHTIDKVLWNTDANPSALAKAVEENNQNSGAMTSGSSGSGTSHGTDSGHNAATQAHVSLPVVSSLMALLTFVGASALLL